jgi:hypothetical protein
MYQTTTPEAVADNPQQHLAASQNDIHDLHYPQVCLLSFVSKQNKQKSK